MTIMIIEKIKNFPRALTGLFLLIMLLPFSFHIWAVTLKKAKKDKEDGLIEDDNWINYYL